MRRESGLNRRSFFHRVTGAALGAGALLAADAKAQGVTDGDTGPNADTAGHGRGGGYSSEPTSPRPLGFVLLIAGAGAAAAGTYLRRKKP